MIGAYISLTILLFCSVQHEAASCEIAAEITPSSIIVSSFAEIRCTHDSTLTFVSFYLPSDTTLTTSNPSKYQIVKYPTYVVLVVNSIEDSDAGRYQCNFQDADGGECFEEVHLELGESVDFCTPDEVTYHAYVDDSVTLECCVDNYDTQWRYDDTNEEISESERITFDGTNLRFNSVTLEDRGEYSCRAQSTDNQYFTLTAYLEVYIRLSVEIDPPQKVVNVSDTAQLTCTAHAFPRPSIVWAREDSTGLHIQPDVVEREDVPINSTTIRSTLTVFNVTEEDTGTYRCTADNINGSLPVTASLQLFGTPSAPRNVLLKVMDQTNIVVTWDRPEDDGHLELLEYSVMWFRLESLDLSGLKSDTVNGTTTRYVITGLLPVTNYTVTIYAMNKRGKGKGSDEKNISTHATEPGALADLLVPSEYITDTSAQIVYVVSNDTGGAPVNKLRILYRAGDEEDGHVITELIIGSPLQTESYELAGLEGDTEYTVRVSVGNEIGFGPEVERSFETLRLGYPATPTSVRVTDIEATSVKLLWRVMDIGRPYMEYWIRANDTQLKEETLYEVKSEDVETVNDEENIEISPLKPETCYVFTVTIVNDKGPGLTSLPSDITCTLTCNQELCPPQGTVEGVAEEATSDSSSPQLIPILVVTTVLATVVLLVVVLVAFFSRRYSKNKSATLDIVSSTNQNFPTTSLTSSHISTNSSVGHSVSSASSLVYPRQNSLPSSITDPDDAPVTGSSIVSDNPFNFGMPQIPNGSPQYQNRPRLYQNGTLQSVASYSNMPTECPQQPPGARSYPLFPIPEHRVAMGNSEISAPVIPNRAHHTETDDTFMTDNPAFEQSHSISPQNAAHELNDSEDATPPPIPPYRGDSYSDTESNLPPPAQQLHVHISQNNPNSHARILPCSQSTQSVPYFGESFSQTSRSPAMPRPDFFLPTEADFEEDEEDEVEFMENSAYESTTPQPQRRAHNTMPASLRQPPEASRPSHNNPKTCSLPRDGSRQEPAPSLPRFEITGQQQRGKIFETVTLKSRV